MNHVMIKLSYIFLPIHEIKCAESFFEIVLELSLVLLPMFWKIIKIGEVKTMVKLNWIFIINTTLTKEGIILPLSLISKLSIWIVQVTQTIHCTLIPISFIDTSVCVLKFSFTVTKTI